MTANFNTDIRSPLEQALFGAFPTTPIAWENVDFTMPNDLWLRPFCNVGGEMPYHFRVDQVVGSFVVEVYTPRGEGSGRLLNTIETIKTTFYRQKFNDLYVKHIMAIRKLNEIPSYNGMAVDFMIEGYSDY